MSDSIKMAIFCLIGYVVFAVVSLLVSPLLLIGLVFSFGTIIAFDVFLFQKFKTKYVWLKMTIIALIDIVWCYVNELTISLLPASGMKEIVINSNFYSAIIAMIICGSAMIISFFEFFLCKVMGLNKEEKNLLVKWFRFECVKLFL